MQPVYSKSFEFSALASAVAGKHTCIFQHSHHKWSSNTFFMLIMQLLGDFQIWVSFLLIQPVLCSCLQFLVASELLTFQLAFHIWKQMEVTWGQFCRISQVESWQPHAQMATFNSLDVCAGALSRTIRAPMLNNSLTFFLDGIMQPTE